MEFRVLGPLEALQSGREFPLGGPKQRLLLAILLLHANEIVSRDQLIDGLWAERPPRSAAHTLDNYVSRLRKVLGEGRLETRPPGYVLRVEPGELDLDRFENLLRKGRETLSDGDAQTAAETLNAALVLWRGPALADLLSETYAQLEARRLEERRLLGLEERIEADLVLGSDSDLVPELERLVRENPFREPLLAQLMLALYRCGRQSEALESYRDGRRRLVNELGIEPSPRIRRLERAILDQDPSLDAEPPVSTPARNHGARDPSLARMGRKLVIAVAVGVVVAASVALALVVETGGGAIRAPRNSVAVIDPAKNSVVSAIPIGTGPGDIAVAAGSVWVANADDRTVSRIDPATKKEVKRIGTDITRPRMTGGSRGVWLTSDGSQSVWRIDEASNDLEEVVHIPPVDPPPEIGPRIGLFSSLEAHSDLWIEGRQGTVSRVDLSTHKVIRKFVIGSLGRLNMTADRRGVWFAAPGSSFAAHIDARAKDASYVSIADYGRARGGRVLPGIEDNPGGVAAGAGAVWITLWTVNKLLRIDPTANAVATAITVGENPAAVAVGEGAVWVANAGSGTVSRIDPGSNRVVKTIKVGNRPAGVAVTSGAVWVTVQ